MKNFISAILLSIVVLSIGYAVGNTSFPLNGEKDILLKYDWLKSWLGINPDSVPDEVLLVNVCYDKALVDYYENDMPVGQVPITDRNKLLQFLDKVRQADNYRYILLDVFFEKGIESEVDSALYATILGMRDIVIPVHADAEIADDRLVAKGANADYTITWEETNFVRYQFVHADIESMPLNIFRHLSGDGINRWGPFYYSHGRLCRNGVTLRLPIKISGEYIDRGDNIYERSYLYLGTDILDVDSLLPVSDQINDKIIVIGDFKNDVHETYVGSQPGSVIGLNAYYALMRGDHYVNWYFAAFLLVLYVAVGTMIFSRKTLSQLVKNRWLKLSVSMISMSLIFVIVATVVYVLFGIVYNFIIASAIFTAIDYGYSKYYTFKHK